MEANSNQGDATAKRPTPPPLPLSVRIQLAAIEAVERSDGTVNRCLYGVIDRLLSARPDKSGVRSYDITVDASRNIWARVFAPATAAASRPLPVAVYYHGGGFALFSPAIGPLLEKELSAPLICTGRFWARCQKGFSTGSNGSAARGARKGLWRRL
ncbi:unnamed protein product [Urochloa humidicola]